MTGPSARNVGFVVVLAAMLALSNIPAGAAHEAAKPLPWETRVLHDVNDDRGAHLEGHNSMDGHDHIALDLQEWYDAASGLDTIRFRLVLQGGWSAATVAAGSQQALKDVIHFKLDGVAKKIEITTTDNAAFSASMGSVAIEDELTQTGAKDGSRFVAIATVPLLDLGASIGSKLTGFHTKGFHGPTPEDEIPAQDPQQDDSWFAAASYVVKGPVQYVDMSIQPVKIATTTNTNETLAIDLANLILIADQNVTLRATIPEGAEGSFHLQTYRANPFTFELTEGSATQVHLFLNGSRPIDSLVLVEMVSSWGGHSIQAVPYQVTAPGAEEAPEPPGADPTNESEPPGAPNGTNGGEGEAEPTPGFGVLAALGALGGAALGRRAVRRND